ncbi:MAG: bis-aminopropyl spermidine synthase family protein [Candidatus Aenigmatarchaeota archaeon]
MERERIARQILQQLISGEKSFYYLLYHQDASIKEFLEIIKEMENKGIIKISHDGKIKLVDKNVISNLKIKKINARCKSCESTGYIVSNFYKKILERFERICKNRPEAIEKYDQGFIDPEGIVRRVEFIHERGDIYRDIIVLGDDDLISIACSLTRLPNRVVVLEIDERIVNFINSIAKKYKLNLEAHIYDAQRKIPREFEKSFDVFITDPVETLLGLKLFFSRLVSALRGIGSSGYFGITPLEASRTKWYYIEKMLYDMGFVITDIKRQFNVYPDIKGNMFRFEEKFPLFEKIKIKSDFDWYNSSFFRVEAVKKPKPLIKKDMIINEKIYKDDESLATPI